MIKCLTSKYINIRFFFIALIFGQLVQAKVQASSELTQILNKYSQASTVEIKLKKTDEKAALGTKTTSDGLLKYSKNKIYIMLNGDKKIEFYYNKNKIWLVEYPDLDFDKQGKRKVTILTKTSPSLIKGLLGLFSNQKKFLKEFVILKEVKEKDLLTVDLKPNEKSLKAFTLIINTKERSLNQIVFVDDVDTKTTLDFDQLKLNKKMSSNEFQFKAQKADEVIPE